MPMNSTSVSLRRFGDFCNPAGTGARAGFFMVGLRMSFSFDLS